jgi:putative ABC transport system substrate-binding protein
MLKKSLITIAAIGLGSTLLWGYQSNAPSQYTEHKTVAITQIVDHPSLNQARLGLIAALKDAGFQEGKNLKIIYQTPHGNLSVQAQISNQYNHLDADVVVAISTPSVQSISSANSNHHPIVFASVTDPVTAHVLGEDVTGTTETPPIEELIGLIKEIQPNAKAIGIIYNPGETNSVQSVEKIKANTDLKVVTAPVSNSMEVAQATNAIIDKVDIIILPSDNTVWSGLEKLTNIAKEHHVPVFTNDPDSIYKGVTLALGYAQYDVGYDAGGKVVKILQGEKPSNMPVTTPKKKSLYINQEICDAIAVNIPSHLLAKADVVMKKEGGVQ